MQQEFAMIPPSASSAWFFALIALVLVPVMVLLLYCAFSMYNVKFTVSDKGLKLRGDLYGRTIAWESMQLDKMRQIDLDQEESLRPKWKTMGTGLPGYKAGWFKLRGGEKGLLYVSDHTQVVDIPTSKGYRVLLSVQDPQGFMAAVRQAAP